MKRIVLLVAAAGVAACGAAQTSEAGLGVQPAPRHARCAPGGGDTTNAGYFEFQVERAAEARSAPAGPTRRGPDAALLQFVFDTGGVPEVRTLRVLEPAVQPSEKLRAAVVTWRFRPAEAYGCRVRQVVQLPVPRSIL